MAAENPLRIIQSKGALYADPTSLSAANYGGTPLGIVKDIVFRFQKRNLINTAEEIGGGAFDVIDLGADAIIAGIMRGLDPDALNKVFLNTSLGVSSGDRVVKLAANPTNRAGYPLSSKSMKLLYAPEDADHGTFVVIYKALPLVEESAEMALHLGSEIGIPIAFVGIPETETGTTKAVASIGRKEDISLTPA